MIVREVFDGMYEKLLHKFSRLKLSYEVEVKFTNLICTLFMFFAVYTSQDMEKDNKSLPMRVFSNTVSSFPIDTKSSKATTSLLQSSQQTNHRHPIHPRLNDVQICPNEIIDLTSAASKEMIPMNLNAQARPYELTKINNNMINIYDVNGQNSNTVNSFTAGIDKGPSKCLDILQGISKGNKKFIVRNAWSLIKIYFSSTDSIIGIRDNNLELKKQGSPPIITLTNSDGKRSCDNLIVDSAADTSGMLNLISNDLDYLLNRTQEVPPISTSSDNHQQHHIHQQLPSVTPPPPVAFSNQAKSPAMLLHDVIMEESEHEVDS